MKRTIALMLSASLFLVACATAPTLYGPKNKDGIGFAEQKIESNRFTITFSGGTDASPLEVEKLALRRAAEMTIENNHTLFHVISKSTQRVGGHDNKGTNVGVSAGGGSRGSGVGVGIGFDLTPTRKSYETYLEILTSDKMLDTVSQDMVYNARSVLDASTLDQVVTE